MKIAGLQKSSTIDYPGQLACVLFTPGCGLNCFYCHNRALLQGGAPLLDMEEVLRFLEKRRGLLDGVAVSGGEPTLQEDLASFCETLKSMGYLVKLDTNGQRPEVVEALCEAGLVDYLAVDVKALPEDYASVTGGTAEGPLRLLRWALVHDIPCEGRTTLYPGLGADKLKRIASLLPPLPVWRLNLFRMPVLCREEDRFRLQRHALTEPEVRALLNELRAVQSGVTM